MPNTPIPTLENARQPEVTQSIESTPLSLEQQVGATINTVTSEARDFLEGRGEYDLSGGTREPDPERIELLDSSVISESEASAQENMEAEFYSFVPIEQGEQNEEDLLTRAAVEDFQKITTLIHDARGHTTDARDSIITTQNGEDHRLYDLTGGDIKLRQVSLAYVDYRASLRDSAQHKSAGPEKTAASQAYDQHLSINRSPDLRGRGIHDPLSEVCRTLLGDEANVDRGDKATQHFMEGDSDSRFQVAQDLLILGSIARGDAKLLENALKNPMLTEKEYKELRADTHAYEKVDSLMSSSTRLRRTMATLGFLDISGDTPIGNALRRLGPTDQKAILQVLQTYEIPKDQTNHEEMGKALAGGTYEAGMAADARNKAKELLITIDKFQAQRAEDIFEATNTFVSKPLNVRATSTLIQKRLEGGTITVAQAQEEALEAARSLVIAEVKNSVKSRMAFEINSLSITPPASEQELDRIEQDVAKMSKIAEFDNMHNRRRNELLNTLTERNFSEDNQITALDILAIRDNPVIAARKITGLSATKDTITLVRRIAQGLTLAEEFKVGAYEKQEDIKKLFGLGSSETQPSGNETSGQFLQTIIREAKAPKLKEAATAFFDNSKPLPEVSVTAQAAATLAEVTNSSLDNHGLTHTRILGELSKEISDLIVLDLTQAINATEAANTEASELNAGLARGVESVNRRVAKAEAGLEEIAQIDTITDTISRFNVRLNEIAAIPNYDLLSKANTSGEKKRVTQAIEDADGTIAVIRQKFMDLGFDTTSDAEDAFARRRDVEKARAARIAGRAPEVTSPEDTARIQEIIAQLNANIGN